MEDAKLEKLIEAQASRIAETLRPELSTKNRRATFPRFSWDFNLGHVMMTIGMLASIFMAYTAIKVEVTEAKSSSILNASEIANMKRRLDIDIGDIKLAVRRIEDKMDAKADKK